MNNTQSSKNGTVILLVVVALYLLMYAFYNEYQKTEWIHNAMVNARANALGE